MFESIVSSCGRLVGVESKTDNQESEPQERRIWVRYPCDVETQVQAAEESDGSRFSARVRNISRGGVNLVVNHEFEPGMLLSVELPAAADQIQSSVLAYVVRANKISDTEWSLGCTFALELSDDDLQPFGVIGIRASASDPRTWVRMPCTAHATYEIIRETDHEAVPARVLNISPAGIGMEAQRQVDVGTLLSLTLRDKGERYMLTILASVVRVNGPAGGPWVWGCNFIREISDRELQALLQDPQIVEI